MDRESDEEGEHARDVARRALARRFGRVDDLERQSGGLSNHVFIARVSAEPVIVRVGGGCSKGEAFRREERVVRRAREAGIPAPEVLGVSDEDGLAVMIARALPGVIARDHPERLRTLQELGAIAAQRIHAIRTSGYGCEFGFDGDAIEHRWREWLCGDFDAGGRLNMLIDHGLVVGEQEDELRRALERMAGLADPPMLNHGDLRLKNVLVDEDGAITGLLDWENCLSARGPYWDLSVALHDLWVDQAQAFLDGYGMDDAEIRSAAPLWRLFNTLNYAPEVQKAAEAADHETLERIRTRFSGALDLFGHG